jgi:hypothetical protein
MYPRIPCQPVADPLGSAEQTLGTTHVQGQLYIYSLKPQTHKTKYTAGRSRYNVKVPCLSDPVKLDNATVRWASDVKYLGLLLDPKLLNTKHLRTVYNKATGTVCNVFPLLNQDSTLSQTSRLTLYKLLIRSLLTQAAPVCNTTCNSNYLKL